MSIGIVVLAKDWPQVTVDFVETRCTNHSIVFHQLFRTISTIFFMTDTTAIECVAFRIITVMVATFRTAKKCKLDRKFLLSGIVIHAKWHSPLIQLVTGLAGCRLPMSACAAFSPLTKANLIARFAIFLFTVLAKINNTSIKVVPLIAFPTNMPHTLIASKTLHSIVMVVARMFICPAVVLVIVLWTSTSTPVYPRILFCPLANILTFLILFIFIIWANNPLAR